MAIVKTVLVNDGGAPSRIINFTAGEALEAGEALKVHTDGTVKLATSNQAPVLGFALTDTANGDIASVVTGRGIVINAITDAVTAGDLLSVDSAKPGFLETKTAYADGTEEDVVIAIALETNATTDTMTKIMVL
jgi:hypothetical protein|tara:strand:- start:105 stop:506 length:402 start_codon:yes stop_codon:yes gene_type:complete